MLPEWIVMSAQVISLLWIIVVFVMLSKMHRHNSNSLAVGMYGTAQLTTGGKTSLIGCVVLFTCVVCYVFSR